LALVTLSDNGGSKVTLTFETSHHALWAEDLARERKIPVVVVPAPAESISRCGLALLIPTTAEEELAAMCLNAGIRFTRWDGQP